MTHDELLAKINDRLNECTTHDFAPANFAIALRKIVELPKEFTEQMNINIVNEQDPVLIAKMFYKGGYKDAMRKVIEAIEKELG
jgi:hypothetical protein